MILCKCEIVARISKFDEKEKNNVHKNHFFYGLFYYRSRHRTTLYPIKANQIVYIAVFDQSIRLQIKRKSIFQLTNACITYFTFITPYFRNQNHSNLFYVAIFRSVSSLLSTSSAAPSSSVLHTFATT